MTATACRVITCRGYATQTVDDEILTRNTRRLPMIATEHIREELRVLAEQDRRGR